MGKSPSTAAKLRPPTLELKANFDTISLVQVQVSSKLFFVHKVELYLGSANALIKVTRLVTVVFLTTTQQTNKSVRHHSVTF